MVQYGYMRNCPEFRNFFTDSCAWIFVYFSLIGNDSHFAIGARTHLCVITSWILMRTD